jgi:hypothetical protein
MVTSVAKLPLKSVVLWASRLQPSGLIPEQETAVAGWRMVVLVVARKAKAVVLRGYILLPLLLGSGSDFLGGDWLCVVVVVELWRWVGCLCYKGIWVGSLDSV